MWFLITGSIVLVISIVICIWAYSSVVNLGQRVKSNQLRGLLHKLPYQEPHKRPNPPEESDGHQRRPSRPSGSPGPGGRVSQMPLSSSYSRRHSYMPPPPPVHRYGNSSSSSSSSPGRGYTRTEQYRKPSAPRRRTESGTMMYSRRRTPQSSSMQRPGVYGRAENSGARPSGPPPTRRPPMQYSDTYTYETRSARPPPQPSGPSGSRYVTVSPPSPPPPPPPPPIPRPGIVVDIEESE
jgi:hypothetical protein